MALKDLETGQGRNETRGPRGLEMGGILPGVLDTPSPTPPWAQRLEKVRGRCWPQTGAKILHSARGKAGGLGMHAGELRVGVRMMGENF